jgi:urea transport system permease protein
VGGAMFTLQVGFMSPSFVGIIPSIEMVIYAAVGGRMSLIGAIYGTLLVNYGKTVFSESFPELWLFLMGALFISVVVFFPNGLAGIFTQLREKFSNKKSKNDNDNKGADVSEDKGDPGINDEDSENTQSVNI